MTSGSQGWSLGHSTLVSLRCLALLVVSAEGEVASSCLKSQRGSATAFKIRRKMFVAEQNLRQLRVLWEGPLAAFHIYFCTFFACAEAADGPRSARSWRGSRCPSLLSLAVTGHCCIGGSREDIAAKGECRKMWGAQDSRRCPCVCPCPAYCVWWWGGCVTSWFSPSGHGFENHLHVRWHRGFCPCACVFRSCGFQALRLSSGGGHGCGYMRVYTLHPVWPWGDPSM